MYDIIFYEDKNGYSEVVQFIRQLNTKSKNSKDAIILSHFKKKTRKTPISEIEKAKRYLNDFLERND